MLTYPRYGWKVKRVDLNCVFNLGQTFCRGRIWALFNIHRHREIQVDEIIVMFADSKKRYMNFVLYFFYIMYNNKK